jgi:hypothetical protein
MQDRINHGEERPRPQVAERSLTSTFLNSAAQGAGPRSASASSFRALTRSRSSRSRRTEPQDFIVVGGCGWSARPPTCSTRRFVKPLVKGPPHGTLRTPVRTSSFLDADVTKGRLHERCRSE